MDRMLGTGSHLIDAERAFARVTRARRRAALLRLIRHYTGIARGRWQRVWLAEERGTSLPPVSVVAVGEDYVLRDGHHRVSVARARGALTIDAMVDAG